MRRLDWDVYFRVLMVVIGVTASSICWLQTGNQQLQAQNENGDKEQVAKIESILSAQAGHWNKKDIDGLMQTYWQSEDLTFSAGGKTTRGWQATLDRYKKKYPPEKMGELTFDHLETTLLSPSSALVLGQWHLKFPPSAQADEANAKTRADGNFSLVLRKLESGWKIIHDHSSSLEPPTQ